MGTRCFGTFGLSAILLFISTRDTICEKSTRISTEKMIDSSNDSLSIGSLKKFERPCNGKKCLRYWMSMLGQVEEELANIQAIIVKDEDIKGSCDKVNRHSRRRHLVCAGSILNRNHVLTSAACLHTSSHIKHNIRGALAVVISPLKPTIQVIRVLEYKIHHDHNTNPYSRTYLKHNLAILQLACRIEMDNFYKVELPQAPFVHTCSEENCLVVIHRKIRRTNYVMYKIIAPHIPLSNRRRKETTIKDSELQKFIQYKNSSIKNFENHRSERKSAEGPIFIGRKSITRSVDVVSSHLSKNWTFENLPVDNLTTTSRTIFDAFGHVGHKTIRSIVVRSTDGHRGCPQTGAPVMLNKTQAAVVAVPCDDRQPSARWGYTDLFDNLDWINDVLQDWHLTPGGPSAGSPSAENGPDAAGGTGNSTACSTCIFNFFIEIGCKNKNQCGNKSISNGQHNHPMFDPRKSATTRSKSQRCSGSNRLGIELDVGQGCEKDNENLENRPEFRDNRGKSLNTKISGTNERKDASLPIDRNDEIGKLDQPVTAEPNKKIVVKNRPEDGDKFTRKDNPRGSSIERKIGDRSSPISRNRETSKSDDKNRERDNEIGFAEYRG